MRAYKRFGPGCSSHRIPVEHERNYGWGMDALVTVFSWNTNGILVWAWIVNFADGGNIGLGRNLHTIHEHVREMMPVRARYPKNNLRF